MNLQYIRIAVLTVICSITVPVSANDLAKGQCAACHGADGNSVNPEWPSLAGQHKKYVVQQLQAFKNGDRSNPNMSAMVTGLSEEDIDELGDYYAQERPKIGSIETEHIAAGEALYRGGNAEKGIPACMACHGPNGAGNPAANYPALRGQHAKYSMIQLKAYRAGERTTDAERKLMMQSIAQKLSDQDIENVSRYVHALH
jgi:cytochrome c553